MHSSTFGKGWVGMSACPLVVLACKSLHVCTVCIWRCEHARFCVEVFYALYINFHSFIHSLIDSLSFATVVFWLHLKTKTKFKEKHGTKPPLSTFHCNQLQHTRSACFKTDLPDHFRFNFVQGVTEPCESVVLL